LSPRRQRERKTVEHIGRYEAALWRQVAQTLLGEFVALQFELVAQVRRHFLKGFDEIVADARTLDWALAYSTLGYLSPMEFEKQVLLA
jgi:hypothetical protein